jgi:hypothetical protein
LITEDNVIGWLATDWTNFALVPIKRLIIVFPFVAAKSFPQQHMGAAFGDECRASENRCSPLLRTKTPLLLAISWFAVPWGASSVPNNIVGGVKQTPRENNP